MLASFSVYAQGRLLGKLAEACQQSLVAEHPYQVRLRRMPIVDLVWEYRRWSGKRYWTGRATDELHMSFAIMVGRFNKENLSFTEQAMVRDALVDYPYWLE